MSPVCKMADNGRLTVDQRVKVVPRPFWRLVSKSCDECKGSFARGCEAKRWSHWTCSSLGTIFHPMRINSVPDVKCFCNNKNVLCVQSMVWHFVRHPVFHLMAVYSLGSQNNHICINMEISAPQKNRLFSTKQWTTCIAISEVDTLYCTEL